LPNFVTRLIRSFEVVAVVTKPPAPSGRSRKLTKSPVHEVAESAGISVMTPEKMNEEQFLADLTSLHPDLCVTAAFGNYLPKRFLQIPKFGTLNIHPSLLPRWRGAAPLQRALEYGDQNIGVTVLFTVQKMDAGPIICQSTQKLNGNELATPLLSDMFKIGTQLLIDSLPSVWDGTIEKVSQNESLATQAPKYSNEEAEIHFDNNSALQIHNKCRALHGSLGTWAMFAVVKDSDANKTIEQIKEGDLELIRVKILETIVLPNESKDIPISREIFVYRPNKDSRLLAITCSDGSRLGIKMLQQEMGKAVNVVDFINGIKKRRLFWIPFVSEKKEDSASASK
jgi:methionyl-tRNA formyltransferase